MTVDYIALLITQCEFINHYWSRIKSLYKTDAMISIRYYRFCTTAVIYALHTIFDVESEDILTW